MKANVQKQRGMKKAPPTHAGIYEMRAKQDKIREQQHKLELKKAAKSQAQAQAPDEATDNDVTQQSSSSRRKKPSKRVPTDVIVLDSASDEETAHPSQRQHAPSQSLPQQSQGFVRRKAAQKAEESMARAQIDADAAFAEQLQSMCASLFIFSCVCIASICFSVSL